MAHITGHAVTHTLRFGEKTVTVTQANAEARIDLKFHGFRAHVDQEGEVTISLDVEEAECTAEALDKVVES